MGESTRARRQAAWVAWLLAAWSLLAMGVATAAATGQRLAPLPALGLAADGVTVSGLSSGGYMAGQFHVGFSATLAGAAVLAGGPYGCSRGSVAGAMYNCSCPANPDALARLRNQIPGAGCAVLAPGALAVFADSALAANRAEIDDPAHLARQRVWLFSGGRDEVVRPALVDALEAFYRRQGVDPARLHREHVAEAAHGLPAPGAPVACSRTASPYLTRCPDPAAPGEEDAPGKLLAWLYSPVPGQPLQAPVPPRAAGLHRFSQQPYRQAGRFDGLDDSGWLYVPAACEAGQPAAASCRLHVVFHGCGQGQRASGPRGRPVGRQFVTGAGYNRWAEANRIVVLYPQVLASQPARPGDTYRLNPEGCWDFWGYTDPDESLAGAQRRFARASAPQMRAVKAMVEGLLRRP